VEQKQEKIVRTLDILTECVELSAFNLSNESNNKIAARLTAARRLIHQLKKGGTDE
jgi:hypothetical protein